MKGNIIYKKIIPGKEPEYAGFPEELHPDIQSFLIKQDIKFLYIHQAEAFANSLSGKNVVITTPTASGKSLCFYLPVIQEILQNPVTRAIFVYPTKALAADQYRALKPWIEYLGEHRLSAGVYDGDTPPDERKRIRERANIILTNPDMLNGSMLPNHSKYGFDFIFANLKYIVLDELHVYRGAFGSHLANVFRRLSRLCRYYHADPQFLCSSATIANPVELAEKICGKSFVCISKSGAGMSERTYCLIQPSEKLDRDGNPYGKESVITVAADLLPQLMEEKESFLAFAKSRKNVEILVKETRDHLDNSGFLGNASKEEIFGYRGGYTPQERKNIEKRMISGELLGLVSTNALELGIDIGTINTTVLVGYPGTRASFWQQTGCAGRGKGKCTNYLILANLPVDQYIALEPEWLFDSNSENAIVDPDNLLIELAHIRAAAAELPLSLDDGELFPDLGETIPVLLRVEEVRSQSGRFVWCGGLYPAGEFSMRNIDQNKYQLLNKETGKNITEMDEEQAFHEIHEGAVYMHDGEFYQVVHMNLESKMVEAVPFHGNYYTVPGSETNIRIIHRQKKQEWERTELSKGLEFDHVFIIGVNDGLIPLNSRDEAAEEEERRLFYVGMTRARKFLELSFYTNPNALRVFPGPGRYLSYLPEKYLTGPVRQRRNAQEAAEHLQDLKKMVLEEKAKKEEYLEEYIKEQNERKEEQTAEKMVEHPKYGRGKVISETEDMIKVQFDDYGEKELMKAFSQLKTV